MPSDPASVSTVPAGSHEARFFRDRCEQLNQKIRQLETEKGVRYFWHNKVLEGNTRAGEILKRVITPK